MLLKVLLILVYYDVDMNVYNYDNAAITASTMWLDF